MVTCMDWTRVEDAVHQFGHGPGNPLSAGTVELRNTLGRTFALELPASLAFDCPTAAAVAEHVASTLRAGRAPCPATA